MSMTGTVTVRGLDFEVRLNPESLESSSSRRTAYSASVNGKSVYSSSYAGIQAAIGNELRKADIRVSVPFVSPDGKRGTAYGLHKSTRRPMVEWEDGAKEQVDVSGVLLPDTDLDELGGLIKAQRRAERELKDFRTAHRAKQYGLKEMVEAAMTEAVEAQEAEQAKAGVEPVELDA
jgi:hypothetical protein